MSSKEKIEFHGLDGKDPAVEAENFIVAIKTRAFEEQKQRNNDWLCDFAATCFRGEALRWFVETEAADSATAENWKLLQSAILKHYHRKAEDDGNDPVPTPAAASPQKPVTKVSSSTQCPEVRYRIRVVEGNKDLGYLGPAANILPSYWDGCLNAASPEEDAFIVVSEPSPSTSNLFRLAVVGPESWYEGKWLGLEWEDRIHDRAQVVLFKDPNVEASIPDDGSASEGEGLARIPTDTDAWHIDLHGNVLPKWYNNKDGSYDETLGFIVNKPGYAGGKTTVLHVKSDAGYHASWSSWYFVKLVLETC